MRRVRAAVTWGLVLGACLGACFLDSPDLTGKACDDAHRCGEAWVCLAGRCLPAEGGFTGSDGGADGGAFDAGPRPEDVRDRWVQGIHGFAQTQTCPGCTLQVDPTQGNRLTAVILGPTPYDKARAVADVSFLGQTREGRLRCVYRLPAAPQLKAVSFLAGLYNAGGQLILGFGLGAAQQLQIGSDPTMLREGVIIVGMAPPAYPRAREAYLPDTDISFELAWTQGESIDLWLNEQRFEHFDYAPVSEPGDMSPASLQLGILAYPTSSADAGWAAQLWGCKLSADREANLRSAP